jgi:hypothetical protein
MPDLIVFTTDTGFSDDLHLDAKCFKRGDVVDVMPPNTNWQDYPGIVEQVKLGRWAVISVPDITDAQIESLKAEEPGDKAANQILQRRAIKLNLNSYADAVKLADPKVSPVDENRKLESVTIDASILFSGVVVKDVLTDPNVIGPAEDNAIGPK